MTGRWCWCGAEWLPEGIDSINECDAIHADVACARHPQKSDPRGETT